jgi:hypothetical protein
MASRPLLLDGVKVLVEIAGGEANTLADFLRASGAIVEVSTEPRLKEHSSFDVVVLDLGDGTLSIQRTTAGSESAESSGRLLAPATAVRHIAHLLSSRADHAKPI